MATVKQLTIEQQYATLALADTFLFTQTVVVAVWFGTGAHSLGEASSKERPLIGTERPDEGGREVSNKDGGLLMS